MVSTRAKHPPAIPVPNFDNLYKLKFDFNDEKILKTDPFVDAITNFFIEADEMNKNVKALIAERTKKKVPSTPKKKTAATTLVRNQIDELRKISFDEDDDDEDASFDIAEPVSSPRRASPVKTTTTSRPSPKKPISTPFRHTPIKPVTPQKKKAEAAERKNKLLQEKADQALERKQKQLQEKAEKIKKDNEEKTNKVLERRMQFEEEAKRKAEATKLKEAKMREFEARQREEARPIVAVTPKQDKRKKEAILTPRQAHIPPKKGKTLPQQQQHQHTYDIPSPERKHKKATPPGEKVTPIRRTSDDIFDVEDDSQSADEEDNVEQLNYEELSPADIENHDEPINYVELTAEEAVDDIRTKSGKQTRAFSFGDVTDSYRESRVHHKSAGGTPAVKGEPMEEDEIEYENDENAAPLQNDVNKSSYDMTVEKVYLPSTATNYNVDDLSSNDETDDEAKPRKNVPAWAKKQELNAHVKKMLKVVSTEQRIAHFGSVQPPTLEFLFNIPNKSRHRHSSAVWQSPLHQPTAGHSRLPHIRR
uniref:Inner centromere protein ARK-binding domain-containing protein n=1 Tax=Panagrolaimus sp. ES5 TaxID=591445 RepID=A0AC34F0K3_9BILA